MFPVISIGRKLKGGNIVQVVDVDHQGKAGKREREREKSLSR